MIQFSTWSLYHNILNISDAEKEAEDDEEEDILKQMDDFIKNWYKKSQSHSVSPSGENSTLKLL